MSLAGRSGGRGAKPEAAGEKKEKKVGAGTKMLRDMEASVRPKSLLQSTLCELLQCYCKLFSCDRATVLLFQESGVLNLLKLPCEQGRVSQQGKDMSNLVNCKGS